MDIPLFLMIILVTALIFGGAHWYKGYKRRRPKTY